MLNNNLNSAASDINLDFCNFPDYDKMSSRDARELLMHIEKKEALKRYTFPEKPCKDGYFRMYVPDKTKKSGRKQLAAKSIYELVEKVYAYENGNDGKSSITFKEVFEIVLKNKLKFVKDPEKRLSRKNSVGVYRSNYTRFFEGTAFEEMPIDTITKKDIEDIIFFNLDRYSLRDKALKMLKSMLKMTFDLAYDEYWVAENIFYRVDFEKFSGMIAPDVDIAIRVHSSEDLKRLLEAAHEHQAKYPAYMPAYALELQIITGKRRGEIPPLRKSDVRETYISITREQITVREKGVPERFVIVDHTKTYKDRRYPRTEAVNEFLPRLYDVIDKYYPDSEFLFPADTENGTITNNMVYQFYSRTCKKLGIKICREETKGPHSFRRNAVTDVVNASGGDTTLAAGLFGHSPAVAKRNYYTGTDEEKALEILNKRKFS